MKWGVIIFRISRWILLTGGMISAFLGLLLLFYAVSGFKPLVNSGQLKLGLISLEKGIPVTAAVPTKFFGIGMGFEYADTGLNLLSGESGTTRLRPSVAEVNLIVQPKNTGERLFYLAPYILLCATLGWCAWQLSFVLDLVAKNQAFHHKNVSRLINVARAIVALQIIYLFLGWITRFNQTISVELSDGF